MQELIRATEQMKVLIVEGQRHVIRPFKRSFGNQEEGFVVKRANYLNTGKALCGVLSPGQTLDAFKQEWIDRRLKETGEMVDLLFKAKADLSVSIGYRDYAHLCKRKNKLSEEGRNAVNLLFENKGLEKPFIN